MKWLATTGLTYEPEYMCAVMCLLCLFIQGGHSFIIFVKLLVKIQKYLEWVMNEKFETVKCNKKQVYYIITHPVVCNFSYACYKIKVCTTSFRYTI
jgi:hypothetical protein